MVSPVTPLTVALETQIASGASITDGINLSGHVLCGVYMPAAWTAAGLTFQASTDGATWADVHFSGSEVASAAGAGQYVALDPVKFYGVRFLKVRSGTSGTPVNQGADRDLILSVGRPDT